MYGYIFICVCMCVWVCMYVYVCLCVYMYVCICVYVYISCILYLFSLFNLLVVGNPGKMNPFVFTFAWGGSSSGRSNAFGWSAGWGVSLGPGGRCTFFLLLSLG